MLVTPRVRGLKNLLLEAIAGSVGAVEETHAAIARKPFWVLERLPVTRRPAAAVRRLHDGIAGGVYGTLRGLARTAARTSDRALPSRASTETEPRSSPPALEHALSALNGFVGDRLAGAQNGLELSMEFRHSGRALHLDREALALAFPDARGRLAVFVHGLISNERWWRLFSEEYYGDASTTYGSRLERDLGYTPLYLRYNTGLHVSQNGELLAERMEALVRAWPTRVDEIVLVGHSMGGLVARSACHQGTQRGSGWVDSVRHVVCLGTPHLGAPLEKLGNVAGWALHALDVTRPLSRIVNGRSAGIKDLRFGYLVEEDWRGRDADAFLEDNRHDIPFLESATHYFVGATLTRSPVHPLGRLLGDALVRFPSASGQTKRRARRLPFRDEHGRHLGPLSHLRLLNHPAVYEQLRSWLQDAPRSEPPSACLPEPTRSQPPRGLQGVSSP